MSLEGGKKIGRRGVIGGIAAMIGVIAVDRVSGSASKPPEVETVPEQPKPPENADPEAFLKFEKDPRTYDMGELAGKKFSGLLSAYSIGEARVVKSHESIDFRYQLAYLWREKLAFVKQHDPGAYPSVLNAAREMFSSYDVSRNTRMSLREYRVAAAQEIADARDNIEWDNLRKLKQLGEHQTQLLRALERNISADGLIAYALTELMPVGGEGAEKGAELLDFLLQNAGVEFLDRIPAIADSRVSAGLFQFTSDALYESDTRFNGASRIQHATFQAGERDVPGSVVRLTGYHQHKAAYLFALDNLTTGILHLGEDRSRRFLALADKWPKDFVAEFVACAHHEPNEARHALTAFVDYFIAHNSTIGKRGSGHAERSFSDFCAVHKNIAEYCIKTKSNIAALKE